jgi:hypothetical protein
MTYEAQQSSMLTIHELERQAWTIPNDHPNFNDIAISPVASRRVAAYGLNRMINS